MPGDDILLWVVDIRYTVGQPNFAIGRDLGWLPGALEDDLTGQSCPSSMAAARNPGVLDL